MPSLLHVVRSQSEGALWCTRGGAVYVELALRATRDFEGRTAFSQEISRRTGWAINDRGDNYAAVSPPPLPTRWGGTSFIDDWQAPSPGLNDAIAETSGDLWVHREKESIWWTISKPDPVEIALMPSSTPLRNGPRIFELHKPAEAWSNSDRKGRRLSWTALHPKARDFLFTEGTLQKLSPDNAEFAIALVEGLSLDAWHSRTDWRAKEERTRKSPTTIYDARKKTIFRMVDTVFSTVAGANGQQVLRTLKDKRTTFDKLALEKFVSGLIDDQDGLCAITGITLQFDDEGTDPELRCSLDRIDSSGHYEPGNLQVVCRFVNRWKNDGKDAEFRRLIELVRSNDF
jgi:hypothetical protein